MNAISCLPNSRRLPRSGLLTVLATAFLLLTSPSLLAAPGGGKGKPGGGGGGGEDPPPPPPVDASYTAEHVQAPNWADSWGVANLNNSGDIVGYAKEKRGGGRYVEGYAWIDGVHRRLPALPGYGATMPFDLNDGGWVIVGESLLGEGPDKVCAWIDFGSGGFTPIDLSSILLDAAVEHLPEWSFYAFESGVLGGSGGDESVLSSDGRFLRVMGRYVVDEDAPDSESGFFDVVVEFDWAKLLEPTPNPVVRMWATRELPGANPEAPFLNGSYMLGSELEIGVRSEQDSSPVVRMVGFRTNGDWYDWYDEPVVWEYDIVTDTAIIRSLPRLPGFEDRSPDGVNIFGAAVGGIAYWEASGNPIRLDLLPDNTRSYPIRSINSEGVVVGPYYNPYETGPAFICTPASGSVDLNTLVEGNLGLTRAPVINDAGQILTVGATGLYILSPIVP